MKIIKRSEICQGVPKRWAEQYRNTATAWQAEATVRLAMLAPEDRTRDTINAIIGNPTWTQNLCDECGKDCPTTIQFGEEPDYEARYVDVCLDCLRVAVGMAEQNKSET